MPWIRNRRPLQAALLLTLISQLVHSEQDVQITIVGKFYTMRGAGILLLCSTIPTSF